MNHYARLGAMVALHFAAMYLLMYSMVDAPTNVFHNLNQVFMAGLMTSSMLIIEVPLMASMYPVKRLNVGIIVLGVVLLVALFVGIRQQAGIGDRQFLRSMIPHHAGAILMCEQASIGDPEIQELCRGIVASQQSEIDFMTDKLERMAP